MGEYRRRLQQSGHFLELVHRLDTLRQLVCRLDSLIHLEQVLVHLLEVLVDKLVHYLRGQVDPNVENSVLVFAAEGLDEVFLDV